MKQYFILFFNYKEKDSSRHRVIPVCFDKFPLIMDLVSVAQDDCAKEVEDINITGLTPINKGDFDRWEYNAEFPF